MAGCFICSFARCTRRRTRAESPVIDCACVGTCTRGWNVYNILDLIHNILDTCSNKQLSVMHVMSEGWYGGVGCGVWGVGGGVLRRRLFTTTTTTPTKPTRAERLTNPHNPHKTYNIYYLLTLVNKNYSIQYTNIYSQQHTPYLFPTIHTISIPHNTPKTILPTIYATSMPHNTPRTILHTIYASSMPRNKTPRSIPCNTYKICFPRYIQHLEHHVTMRIVGYIYNIYII